MTFETNIPLGESAAALHANNTNEEVGETGESHHDSHYNNQSTVLAEEPMYTETTRRLSIKIKKKKKKSQTKIYPTTESHLFTLLHKNAL